MTLSDILRDAAAANSPPPAPPPPPNELGEALVAHKLVPNNFILDLNRGLTVPYDIELPTPWNLPSQMFRFQTWLPAVPPSIRRGR